MTHGHGTATNRTSYGAVLRALREARGVTQEGWAGLLGVSRATVQRWERGSLAPSAAAEAAIIAACETGRLFRVYTGGPLDGISLTAEFLHHLLAETRLNLPSLSTAAAERPSASPAPLPAPMVSGPPAPVGVTPLSEMSALVEQGYGSYPTNLPAPLTSFVGRTRELAELRQLLAGSRLVTLTGSGGTGKTRLALRLAADAHDRFEGGVWLVELAAVTDAALVARAVATALGLREQPGQDLTATLVAELHDKTALLVFDNCEHLLAACAGLTGRLLAACPALTVLATSRRALAIAGERVWRAPPLSIPPAIEQRSVTGERPAEPVTRYESVRLFLARATTVAPGFRLTNGNAEAAARICVRLDGLPLAIELAAARIKVLSAQQIAARLDERFRLLTGGDAALLPRQQTLRAAMDWSHDLLSGAEQVLFRRLAVFAGGMTLEAVEAIGAGDGIEPDDVLDQLTGLVEQSLLLKDDQAGAARYRLLETVRQYAADRLGAAGEQAAVQARHRDFFTALALQAEAALRGPDQAVWLERLDAEHDNLRAVLGWCVAGGGAAQGLQLAAALRLYWLLRGHPGEGRRWLESALDAGEPVPIQVRAQALDGAAALAHNQGDIRAAHRFQLDALALWRELANDKGIAVSLSTLGVILKSEGRLDEARAALTESLALMQQAGITWGATVVLNNLAATAIDAGDYHQAIAYNEQSLALKRQAGDRSGIAVSLHNLGESARSLGDLESATRWLEESLALSRELGNPHRAAQTLHSLALCQLARGEHARAETSLSESFAMFEALEFSVGKILCVEGFAAVASAAGDHRRAARLLARAERAREQRGAPLPPADLPEHERIAAAARAALGDAAFAAAWAIGRATPLKDAGDRP